MGCLPPAGGHLKSQQQETWYPSISPQFLQPLENQRATGILIIVSKITLLQVEEQLWHSEMINRKQWWSDLTLKCRHLASRKLLPKLCQSSLGLQ